MGDAVVSAAAGSIFRRLSAKQIVMPYLENAFHADEWPETYDIKVDSSPYYGLTDEEGVTHDVGVGDGYFHPSSHPNMPARELYYLFHPEHHGLLRPERRNLTNHMTLAVGTAMHAVVQTQLTQAKVLHMGAGAELEWAPSPRYPDTAKGCYVPDNPFEWEYINDEHMVRGRIDGVLTVPGHEGKVFEFKTQNSRSFKFQDDLKVEWDTQTQLGMDQYGSDEGVLVLLEMGYPFQFREFPLKRSAEKLDRIYGKFAMVRECIQRDTPPPCEHALLSAAAKSCPLAHICWPES